jgi:hypothetical protein
MERSEWKNDIQKVVRLVLFLPLMDS